ncbi:MAG: accessory Sec system translocase SecA2, partial [Microbacterium sp.]
PLFALLGLEVAAIGPSDAAVRRRRAYRADVVYASVAEIGYDVLRDRFATRSEERVDPPCDAAVVDEADAVMIDEAMTPLVLAGAADAAASDIAAATALVRTLSAPEHYAIDPDGTTVSLTDAGYDLIEQHLGGVNLFDTEHAGTLTRINLALHARMLLHRDVDYLVADGRIQLINTARGRVAQRQRWPDGLQAAVEAKEGLGISAPGEILDQLTVQDLLGRYRTLAGMSGTILPVAEDLIEFYGLRSGRIPRHRPDRRVDLPLEVLTTEAEKTDAVIGEILRRHAAGQPVLVGTQDVAESERLADLLPEQLDARVLNARNDADEAAIVGRAGEHGAVTVSTQISGRGTDIRLGGSAERDRRRVAAAGGLAVIQTGLFPSQRLDRQLRGRAARQGDPGVSIAFASLEDELVQTNSTEDMRRRIARAPVDPRHRRKLVLGAQRVAESVRQERHRATWQYTRIIAEQRAEALTVREQVLRARADAGLRLQDIIAELENRMPHAASSARTSAVRGIALFELDRTWTDHLGRLAEVRDGIHLRRLAGQDPVEEF